MKRRRTLQRASAMRPSHGAAGSAELLALVVEQVVDSTLHLRRGGAQLEPEVAGGECVPELRERLEAHVLQRVPEAGREVRQVPLERPLVHHGARHALGHPDGRVGGEVAVGRRALVHGVDGAHAAVRLEPDAVLVKVVAGRLVRAGQQRAHHDGRRAARQRL
eukprot:scaffold7960_cov129-Isochrysis_galbana.AAC.3